MLPVPRGAVAGRLLKTIEEVFFRYYRPRSGDVVLEVGAGSGTETVVISELVGDQGLVVAIEAHPRTYGLLAESVRRSRRQNVETLLAAAVSDSSEEVFITDLPDDDNVANNILEENSGGGLLTPAVTLDDVVSRLDLESIDYLKMNIEGAEASALDGMRDSLKRVRNVAVSCHDFLAEGERSSLRTREKVQTSLTEAGFILGDNRDDPRPWAASYVFGWREPVSER